MDAVPWVFALWTQIGNRPADPHGKKCYLFAEAVTGAEAPFNLEICEITF